MHSFGQDLSLHTFSVMWHCLPNRKNMVIKTSAGAENLCCFLYKHFVFSSNDCHRFGFINEAYLEACCVVYHSRGCQCVYLEICEVLWLCFFPLCASTATASPTVSGLFALSGVPLEVPPPDPPHVRLFCHAGLVRALSRARSGLLLRICWRHLGGLLHPAIGKSVF